MLYAFGSKDLPSSIVHGDKSETVLDWTSASDSSNADVELFANAPADLAWLIEQVEALQPSPTGCHIGQCSGDETGQLVTVCSFHRKVDENARLRAELDVACEGLEQCRTHIVAAPYVKDIVKATLARMGRGGG